MGRMDNSLLSSFIFSILFSTLLISPSFAADRCNPSDKKVLLQIKAAFGNPYILASWKSDTDCCTWYCVKCNSTTNRIYQLTIFDGELSGQIPAAIGSLPYLEMVDLNNLSNVTGPIPAALGNLQRLTFLRLNHLNLTGSIPSALGKLTELTLLYLNDNKLTGSIPQQLTQLTNLNALDLSSNQLCGQIPVGGKLQSFDADSYADNKCLCGAPLASCK